MKTTLTRNLLAAGLVGFGAMLPRGRQNLLALVGALAFTTTTLCAQEAATGHTASAAELAKKLQNPIASLISVPLKNNFDFGAGPKGDGFQYRVNIQPVIPFSISKPVAFQLGYRY